MPIKASLEEEEAFVESFRKAEHSDVIREVLFGLPKSSLGNPLRVFGFVQLLSARPAAKSGSLPRVANEHGANTDFLLQT